MKKELLLDRDITDAQADALVALGGLPAWYKAGNGWVAAVMLARHGVGRLFNIAPDGTTYEDVEMDDTYMLASDGAQLSKHEMMARHTA